MLKFWNKKPDYIRRKNRLAVFVIHPEDYDLGHLKRRKTYKDLLSLIISYDPEFFTCRTLTKKWKKRFLRNY